MEKHEMVAVHASIGDDKVTRTITQSGNTSVVGVMKGVSGTSCLPIGPVKEDWTTERAV